MTIKTKGTSYKNAALYAGLPHITLSICSPASCAWLRLGAGCAMLKVCEQQGVGDEYTVDQLYNLSILVTDELKEVRQTFVSKLQKGLARGVPFKCLPLDFMGFYALVGLEADKQIREATRRAVVSDISRRRDFVKGNPQLTTGYTFIQPDTDINTRPSCLCISVTSSCS